MRVFTYCIKQVKKIKVETLHLYTTSVGSLVLILLVLAISSRESTLGKEHPKKEPDNYEETHSMFDSRVFDGIELEAKAYVVYDITTKSVIASYHEEDKLPLASITKVMTTLTALSLDKEKESVLTIEPKYIEEKYDLGLKEGQKWELKELLKYMLIFSSNDAALTVAENMGGAASFVLNMNLLSQELGLSARFSDPAGRDERGLVGGEGTALDAAKLFALARERVPEVLDATTKKRQSVFPLSGKMTGVPNTNQYIETISGAEASKTGYTDLAGGNLGVIVDAALGRPVVIVVLGSSREGRFRDIKKLHDTLLKSIVSFPTEIP